MKPCKHSKDGYCIRSEKDYFNADECKGCDHKETKIAVLEVTLTYEKTAIQCDNCGKLLTEPKIDCA